MARLGKASGAALSLTKRAGPAATEVGRAALAWGLKWSNCTQAHRCKSSPSAPLLSCPVHTHAYTVTAGASTHARHVKTLWASCPSTTTTSVFLSLHHHSTMRLVSQHRHSTVTPPWASCPSTTTASAFPCSHTYLPAFATPAGASAYAARENAVGRGHA